MMKVIKNSLWALGIAALSACTMDEMDSAFDKVPVEFSVVDSAAAQMTRATSSITTFNASEKVKVYVKPNGASSYTGYDYTTAAAGNAPSLTAPSTPPYFPAGSSTTVQAYAYYPSTAGTTFSVSTNQTTDANYKASDLMYASNRTITKGSTTGTALAMSHKMAQLKLVVAAASGSGLSISSVKVNAKYQVSFTASSGAATVTGSATDITALTAAGTGYILIPPQAINGITVKVTASSQTATYTFTSTNSLEAGKSYTMNLTVGLNDVGVTTSISTWSGSGTVTVQPTVTNAPANAVAVDLGLSVKWANMNVGATSVTDYGTYFAWGETSGYTVVGASDTPASGNVKTYFSWDTYAWCKGTNTTLTKYCPTDKQSSYWWDTSGNTVAADNKTQLELGDDAARANWGGKWRMPTQTEMQELADTKSNTTNYTWTWCDGSSVKYNNTTVKGWKIESKKSGTAGNHIFLPAAGCRFDTYVSGQGSDGYCWSSTLNSDGPRIAYDLYFSSSRALVDYDGRCGGYSVRAVWDPVPYTRISNATSSDVGKVICSNGHIHNTVSAVDCGGTAVAMIVYVGTAGTADASSSTYKGLAIALTDASTSAAWYGTTYSYTSTCVYQNSTFNNHYTYADMNGIANTNQMANKTGKCSNHNTHAAATAAKNYSVTVPSGCSQWFLPTSGQWMRFFRNGTLNLTWSDWGSCTQGATGFTNVNKMFTDAGASGAVFSSGSTYWASSEYNDGSRAVYVYFSSSSGVTVGYYDKGTTNRVRPFLAF